MFYRAMIFLLLSSAISIFAADEIKISSVSNGQRFEQCANITITAEINITGDVNRVYFYQNGRSLKSIRTAPFEYLWESVPTGIYELTAKVKDKDNNEFFSDPITIFVDPIEDGDMVQNGEFECSAKPWILTKGSTGDGYFVLEEDSWLSSGNFASVEVVDPGANPWDIMIYQSSALIAEHEYEITFSADALEKGEMIMSVQTDGGDWQAHIYETVKIEGPADFGPYILSVSENIPKAQFRLMVGGTTGNVFFFDNVKMIDKNWEMTSAVESDKNQIVSAFTLEQNYPNPFNPITQISYELQQPTDALLAVYNIQGELVATLVNEFQQNGSYTVSFDGSELASGIYYYKLTAGSQTFMKKMTLLK